MSSTHSANPIACAAGIAVLDEIKSKNLIFESHRKGKILNLELEKLKEKSNGNVAMGFVVQCGVSKHDDKFFKTLPRRKGT